MVITVLFFGAMAEQALASSLNADKLTLELNSTIRTAEDLKVYIDESANSIAFNEEINKSTTLCSINQTIIPSLNLSSTLINDGDEIAFMSALSGG